MSIDVKKLAALPGFGAAQAALAKELGPFAAATGPIEVRVTVKGRIWHGDATFTCRVKAASLDEAKRLATDKAYAAQGREWEPDDISVDIDDDDIQVEPS